MSIISELLEKANMDNKKGLLKEEQKQYRAALVERFKESGLSEENIFYFTAGVKYGTVNAFVSWNREFEQEKQTENVKELLNSQRVKSLENVGKLRVVLMLLIAELNGNVNDSIVVELMYLLDDLSYKKDGQRLSDLGKIFKNSFVAGLKNGTKLPAFTNLNFSKEYEARLVSFFEEAIAGLDPRVEEDIDRRDVLRAWMNKQSKLIKQEPLSSDGEMQKTKGPEKDVLKGDVKQDAPEEIVTSVLGKRLLEMAKAVDQFDKTRLETEERCKKKEREVSQLKTSYDKLEELYKQGTDENLKLRKEIMEMKTQLEEHVKKNKELEERVSRQVSVIDVFDEDKANSKNELLNQIATSLKKIYADFKMAETMEMTIDLGENMRDSLDDVFRKLRKLGIDIEGR